MSTQTKKPIILVQKDDAKNSNLWHDLANKRIIKQHGGYDIPEGDLHAIQKYDDPVHGQEVTPEETQEALSDLEKEIQQLKQNDHTSDPQHTTPEFEEFYDKNK